jgi:hypothetical protein
MTLFAFFIFIVIMFLYIHIQDQYKKGEDLEVYEMDYASNEHLQSVCAMKQPVLFHYPLPEEVAHKYESDDTVDIPLWDIRDYCHNSASSIDPILLSYKSFENLAKSDPKGYYFTRKNEEWLKDVNRIDDIKMLNPGIKPPFSVHSSYELLMGSAGVHTPLQYHMDDRQFFFVTNGKISVKMTPWRSRKYMTNIVNDYDNYEFYSRTNPWIKGVEETSKIKWLDFDVVAGYVLYIPPWWWYSIRFSSVDTQVIGIHYQTAGNILAHLPDWARYYFQFHMTKRITTRTLEQSLPTPIDEDPPQPVETFVEEIATSI